MGNRLYKRVARVTIAKPTGFHTQEPNAVEIENLRVQFRVEKNLRTEPNTCEVVISNLAERTRAEVQVKPLYVRVEAGYDGDLKRLFTGDLRWSESRREGADWETVLQLGDGDRAFKFGRVSRSYRGGVDAYTAIVEAAKGLGFTEVKVSPAVTRELRAQFTAGVSLSGPAGDELSRLLSPHGLSWSIQDSRLQILRADEARSEAPIQISQDTGLIGSPDPGAPSRPKEKPIWQIRTLLHPELVPGGIIDLQSIVKKGRFKITRLVHVGDTHGKDWTTEIEATPL